MDTIMNGVLGMIDFWLGFLKYFFFFFFFFFFGQGVMIHM